jgi:hypothetical protein
MPAKMPKENQKPFVSQLTAIVIGDTNKRELLMKED